MVGALQERNTQQRRIVPRLLARKVEMQLSKPMQWVDINSIAFTFLARKNTTMNNTIIINNMHGNQAKATLMWLMKLPTYNTLNFDNHVN